MIDRDTKLFLSLATSKAFVVLTGLVVTILVGRLLGPSGFGQWALFMAAGALLHTALINWTHGATVRFGCDEWTARRTLTRTLSTRAPLVLASAAVTLMLLVFQPFQWVVRGFGVSATAWPLIGVCALSLWVAAEAQAMLQATDRIGLQAAVGPLAALASIVAVWGVAASGAASVPAMVVAVSLTSVAVWGAAWGSSLIRARIGWRTPSSDDLRAQLSYGLPMLFGFGIGYVSDWGDHLLLRLLASVEAVGYFGLAYQVFLTLTAAGGVLSTLVLPRLIAAEHRTGAAARSYLEETVPTVFVLWAIPAFVGVAVVPPLLAMVVGAQFAQAGPVLIVLCAIVPSQVVTSLYTVLFSLQHRQGWLLAYTGVMAAVNVAFSLFLIPRFGAIGAAGATAISYVVVQLAYLTDQHRQMSMAMGRMSLLWMTVSALGALQVAIGGQLHWRVLWAAGSIVAVAWVARRTGIVSARLIEKLFSGVLSPVGVIVRRVVTA